eukprot:COSAG01_NODE_315_length_19007_cov_18.180135_9_plen_109_part_00
MSAASYTSLQALEAQLQQILRWLQTLDDSAVTDHTKRMIRRQPNIQALLNMSAERLWTDLADTSENSFTDSQLTGSTIGSGSVSGNETSMHVLLDVPDGEEGKCFGNR